jgi:hypothetical protein
MPNPSSLPADEAIRQMVGEVVQRPDYDLAPVAGDGLTIFDVIMWLLKPLIWLHRWLSTLSPVLAWVVIIVLVVVLLALLVHIGYSFYSALGTGIRLRRFQPDERRESVRPEFYEEKAQGAVAEQNYIAAVRFLFRAALLRLEQVDKRPARRGATNREHLRRYRNTSAFESMRQFVEIIDAKWYGTGDCLAEDYAACLNAHSRIREVVKELAHADRP